MNSVKLRNPHEKDRAAVIAMLRDSEVMRFLGPRRALTEDEADSWFENAFDSPSRFVIAAKACELVVEKLATKVDLEAVQVFIAEDNVASRKVAEKLGWQELLRANKDGEYGLYYRITM